MALSGASAFSLDEEPVRVDVLQEPVVPSGSSGYVTRIRCLVGTARTGAVVEAGL